MGEERILQTTITRWVEKGLKSSRETKFLLSRNQDNVIYLVSVNIRIPTFSRLKHRNNFEDNYPLIYRQYRNCAINIEF